MGVNPAHCRAFAETDIAPGAADAELLRILTIIREGFAAASKPEPRRPPPDVTDETFKPPVTPPSKSQSEPWNLNRHNPGRILRVFRLVSPTGGHDIFVEVNQKKMTRPKYWAGVRERLAAEPHSRPWPVYLRVDHARRVNGAVCKQSPFYSHVLTHGTLLYERGCNIWARDLAPLDLPPATVAGRHMDRFQREITAFTAGQRRFFRQKNYRRAGFQLRNSIEAAYHMILTVLQGHSYPESDIAFLRGRAEALVPDLRQPWFYKDEDYEAEFERLRHAHGGTHKARQYKMSEVEIKTLSMCQKRLLKMAERLCRKKISSSNERTS